MESSYVRMILQALYEYYNRLVEEEDPRIAPPGYQQKEIPWIIVLDKEGNFKGLEETWYEEGSYKRARTFQVPTVVKDRRGLKISANLLWDNPDYILGMTYVDKNLSDKQKDRLNTSLPQKRAAFLKRLKDELGDLNDDGLKAVIAFLERGNFSAVVESQVWKEYVENGGNINIGFRFEVERRLICERPMVRKYIQGNALRIDGEFQTCLVTGKDLPALRLHSSFTGLGKNAQPSGAYIVSFNKGAFNSYGKDQSFNAPVSSEAEFAYSTALSLLLSKDSRQQLRVGDTKTVFWTASKSRMEDVFAEFFQGTVSANDHETTPIRELFCSTESGVVPIEEDLTAFFVAGLSPFGPRIAIRFWYAGTVAEVARNIRQHFEDCMIVHGPKDGDHLPLFRLLVSTALQGKADNIQPNLAGSLMNAILVGKPYPQTLLSSAVRRVRAEREVPYARAALIKACLNRQTRYFGKNLQEVTMALDRTIANPGYLLGRLFAVLENIQEQAQPGINATIRDRFYASASSTPAVAFPHLLKISNHHLSKIKKEKHGMAVNLEKEIGQIMNGLDGGFPGHLKLEDQGRFAVGYYQQRQDRFSKKTVEQGDASSESEKEEAA